jgi:peptide/nickel transport system ATP-binding protein
VTTLEKPTVDRTTPVLTVRNLDIEFWVDGTWYPAVVGAEFDLRRGEVLAIVGESGSGKSTTAMSMLGLLPKNAHVSGSIELAGKQLVGASERTLRRLRGREISVIFQEPMTALNPVYTVGFQIAEMLRSHRAMSPVAARARAIELLTVVEIPDPERRVDSYPHQLSGGQRQRVMIAQALALDPELLVADEPTTALDVTVQAEILRLMRNLKDRVDAGIVLITHDMGVVADMADRILVMKDGNIVESGTAREIFKAPKHPYTIQLLDAVPHLGGTIKADRSTGSHPVFGSALTEVRVPPAVETDIRDRGTTGEAVVSLNGVAVEYPKRGRTAAFRAVDNFTLDIHRGEVVGLVGESGSGKTTVGRAMVGLLPFVEGTASVVGSSMVRIAKKDLRTLRRKVSFVFQDPGSSLNPRVPVGESIGEPLLLHKIATGKDLSNRVEALLDQVNLSRTMRNRYPHELSGGQRQRVGIARSLALEPELLIADEPTSALDVSVQAKVLELFQDLQREKGFACLFISHDLAVVEMLSARIAVLHHGNLVEVGTREQILNQPQQAYTQRLLAAVPVPDPDEQKIRREKRDELIAAGIGVEADDDSVFGAAAASQLAGSDTASVGGNAPFSDGSTAVESFVGTAALDASATLRGDDAEEGGSRTTTDPLIKDKAVEDTARPAEDGVEGVDDRDRR